MSVGEAARDRRLLLIDRGISVVVYAGSSASLWPKRR
jgi:hypothetical protein